MVRRCGHSERYPHKDVICDRLVRWALNASEKLRATVTHLETGADLVTIVVHNESDVRDLPVGGYNRLDFENDLARVGEGALATLCSYSDIGD